jgi:hypothetical protein
MPKNRIIYIGIIILVATALLWLGIQLHRIQFVLPYATGVGITLVVGGFIYELWKSKRSKTGDESRSTNDE